MKSALTFVFLLCSQTAVEFDSGKLDEDGNPPPFQFSMLYDVIRQLRATPELIFMSWSQSLDYNIGTAAHTMAAMTALCEHFQLQIGDWFRRPVSGEPAYAAQSLGSPASSPVPMPAKLKGETLNEYNNRMANFQHHQNSLEDLDKLEKLPLWMDIGGIPREERLDMLKMYERQRRATSLYRHTCTLDGNTDIEMHNPVQLIDRVMRKHGNPIDMDPTEASTIVGDCLPVYPSVILASTVQTCFMYNPASVLDWCRKDTSGADVKNMGVTSIGARKGYDFSERKSHGPCRYNTAWLRVDGKDGLRSFANTVMSNNKTCKMFDLPQNALRDAFYLLTTRDNSRRCTEEPHMPRGMTTNDAFRDETGDFYDDKSSGRLYMAGISDGRGTVHSPGTEALKRHPYAKVPDIKLQRQIDFATNGGRLPAMLPIISNNVRDTAPVRLISDGDKKYMEINTSAAQEHTKMLAEASIRCSVQPGLENLQEAFCGETQGPDGLCIDAASGVSQEGNCTRMAYSFDMVSIALTLDAMGRYYDPNRKEYVNMYNSIFSRNLGVVFKAEDLPHMCLRFVGYEDSSDRRFVSIPVNEERNKAVKQVEVGDGSQMGDDFDAMYAHLELSLGHRPSDEEVERYLKSRAGSRSMSGVRGDLMDMTTYIEHTLTTMKERGMLLDENDVVMQLVQDDPYGLRSRVAEIAGREINKIVDKHPDVAKAKLSLPPNHEDLPEEKISEHRTKAVARTRVKLYERIDLPDHLDSLRNYAPLNIPEVGHFTFHNIKKNQEKKQNAQKALEGRNNQIDSSSQFKNQKRVRENSVPGKKQPTSAGAGPSGTGTKLSTRGYVDGRSKAPMRM